MYKNWEIKGRKPQSADEPVEWEAWFTTRFIEECLLRYKAGDWGDTRAYLQVGVLNHFEAVTMGFSLVARDSGRKGSALEIVRRSRLALELLNVLEDEEDSESNVVATDVESGPRKRHAKEGINADSNLAQTLFKMLAENVLEPIRQQRMPSMKNIDEIVAYVEEHQDEDELWSDPGFEDAELFDYYRRELLPYIRDVWLEAMIEWERGKTADILKKFKNCVKKLALKWSGQ
ncbi:hypothetical protein FRB99_000632 [Tulasnella sp. 403]|nr:hypothetical protein FRB99_000632 [Tulasnella sp. 403]